MPALGSSPVISIVMRETPTLSGDTSRTVLGLRGSSNVTNSGQAPSSRGLPPGKGLGRVRGKSTGPAILTLARCVAATRSTDSVPRSHAGRSGSGFRPHYGPRGSHRDIAYTVHYYGSSSL